MNKLIKVRRKHIEAVDRSFLYGSNNCPVALAFKDAGYKDAVVCTAYQIFLGKPAKMIRSPRSVSRFVNRFDDGKKVKPFNFILKITK